jgi:hypothetical protein
VKAPAVIGPIRYEHKGRHRKVFDHFGNLVCDHPYEETEPDGYCAWHEWAPEYFATHPQHRCPRCKLYVCR